MKYTKTKLNAKSSLDLAAEPLENSNLHFGKRGAAKPHGAAAPCMSQRHSTVSISDSLSPDSLLDYHSLGHIFF